MRQEQRRPPRPKHPRPKRPRPGPPETAAHAGARVAKVIARAGLCSRRDAEAWITQGRVAVNGAVLASPAVNVVPGDMITVDGKPLEQRQRSRLFLFHKPRGLVTTNKDPQGRPTIFDHLAAHHAGAPRLVSIGRLDINTEGLLLLTNDGGLARVLELPATGWLRRYRVRANGTIDQAKLDVLKDGLTLDGIHYAGIEAALDRVQGANVWLTMGLREGKNREIKRVLEHLGLAVNRLIRLSYGPFQLGDLKEGGLEEVRTRVLRDQLGPALLEQAGVDLEAPLAEDTPRPERPAPSRRPPAPRGKTRARRPTAEAEPEKPRHRPKPGPRKHVSVLREEASEKEEARKAPRQRIVRDATADRKGRTVAVERRTAAAPAKAAKVLGDKVLRNKGLRNKGLRNKGLGDAEPPRPSRGKAPKPGGGKRRAGAPGGGKFGGHKPAGNRPASNKPAGGRFGARAPRKG